MPFDGSGNYSRVHDWTTDRDNSIKIQASRMDEEFDDIASSLNAVFFRNGLVPMTGDLDMGANDISDIAAGTAAAPSFSFFGDPNSGMYLAGVNSLGFTTNGTKRVGITNAGLAVTGAITATTTIDAAGNITGNNLLATTGSVTAASGIFTAATVAGSPVWHSGNDGAGSGLDADLLDGQQGAYYLAAGSYTAADVLAKLVTVDGSGSGLDADLLDGLNSTAFAQLSGATFTGEIVAKSSVHAWSTVANSTMTLGRLGDAIFNNEYIIYSGYNSVNPTVRIIPTSGLTNFMFTSDMAFLQSSVSVLHGTTETLRFNTSTITFGGNTVWHAGNDGSGSGLDADLLDGLNSSAFAQLADSTPVFTGQNVYITGIPSATNGFRLHHNATDAYIDYSGSLNFRTGAGSTIATLATTGLSVAAASITAGGNTVWHAGNDGAGSGLDADLLDGAQGSAYALLAGATFTGSVGVGGAASVFPFEVHGASANFAIRSTDTGQAGLRAYVNGVEAGKISWSGSDVFFENVGVERLRLTSTGALINGSSTVWHAGNDGAGSGLDADLLDGIESRTIRGIERSTAAIDTSLVGKCKAISAGVTVPASTFAAGDSFALYNDSAAAVTITQGSGLTQRLNGTTTTGNRTLAARGFATIWFNSTTECVISGAVT